MIRTRQTLAILISFILILLTACNEPQTPVVRRDFAFGTYFTLTIYDTDRERSAAEAAIDSALGLAKSLEQKLNPYDARSIIGKLNADPTSSRSIALPADAAALAKAAIELSETSQGAFDFTLWPVFRLWNFDSDSAAVPSSAAITSALANVDFGRVALQNNQLTLPVGTEVDFGAISKGFAVEQIREFLKHSGFQRFIIDMGGNLGIEWQGNQPIDVLIRHPRQSGAFYGKLTVNRSCGIATSGDYHFYFETDGKRYHHILDPGSGYPAEDVVSTTIVAPTATIADGLSTAAMVMGREKGLALIGSQPGVEGLMVYEENNDLSYILSGGLQPIFSLITAAE